MSHDDPDSLRRQPTAAPSRRPSQPPDPGADTAPSVGARPTPAPLARVPSDPAWARPALLGLLLATAAFYLYNLTASGWANSFYSAAVQAGSDSWKAFFFGSSDAAQLDHRRQAPGRRCGSWPCRCGSSG